MHCAMRVVVTGQKLTVTQLSRATDSNLKPCILAKWWIRAILGAWLTHGNLQCLLGAVKGQGGVIWIWQKRCYLCHLLELRLQWQLPPKRVTSAPSCLHWLEGPPPLLAILPLLLYQKSSILLPNPSEWSSLSGDTFAETALQISEYATQILMYRQMAQAFISAYYSSADHINSLTLLKSLQTWQSVIGGSMLQEFK